MLLQNRVAIVSGIGPGMGRDISLAFAEQGADLVLAGRTPSKLDALAQEIAALGRSALCVVTDIAKSEDCRNLVARAQERFGHIDVLVNNAFHPSRFALFEKDDLDNYRDPIEVNTLGTLRLTQAVLPVMKAQRKGSIIMINSMVIRDVLPTMTAYAVSKAGLMAATQGIAREVGCYGIRVNSVVPGYIWGESLEEYFQSQATRRCVDPKVVYEETAMHTALGKIPDSKEIAGAVVFFASDLACAVTGQALDVNGGHIMR